MTKKKSTVTITNPGSRAMLPTRKGYLSTSERLEKRKAVAPSSDERPAKWSRGGRVKKIKEDGKAEQDGKVGQPLRYLWE
jgi:hypothetical protein